MGFEYALVHIKYTVPPAVLLTLFYQPLWTRLASYKTLFLILIAVISTIPWDSYLIRSKIWTYPANVIIGPTLFAIPAEECFFFVIQTYITSLLYLILSIPTFHPVYLRGAKLLHDSKRLRQWRWAGTSAIVVAIVSGLTMVMKRGEGLYLGLILIWAGPFILLLWCLAYQFILALPKSNTLMPILVPTVYLWIVDTLALKRGTWTIESGTKLGWHLWKDLEIEEATFFLLTNTLIVFGMIAFDNALAVLQTFHEKFPTISDTPSPIVLIQALLLPPTSYDESRIEGLAQALQRLKAKSRSFYLASGAFQGRLRIDLITLYSFCRVADDLVDEAANEGEARQWIGELREYLDLSYCTRPVGNSQSIHTYVISTFPVNAQAALLLLPTASLSPAPLYDLLLGFETDLAFSDELQDPPIADAGCLKTYGARVAGTVAESCLELVYHHTLKPVPLILQKRILGAGRRMGIALQYVNIARDIAVDAAIGRVYIPTTWLQERGMKPSDVLRNPSDGRIEVLRQKLLDEAMYIYGEARGAIEELPSEARSPMRVAVESYVEIGRVLRTNGYRIKAGRATVPKARRLKVAWRALKRG